MGCAFTAAGAVTGSGNPVRCDFETAAGNRSGGFFMFAGKDGGGLPQAIGPCPVTTQKPCLIPITAA